MMNLELGHLLNVRQLMFLLIGIDGHTLIRLQDATNQTFLVEILQGEEVVYSFTWDFQEHLTLCFKLI